jgi:hypothetical protein
VLGGFRNAVTVYPSKAGLLADIYDELIIAVEGYAVGGQPLENKSADPARDGHAAQDRRGVAPLRDPGRRRAEVAAA